MARPTAGGIVRTLGDLGVVAGLVLVALQIHIATKQASAGAHQSRIAAVDASLQAYALSDALPPLYVKLHQAGLEALDPADRERVRAWEHARLVRMQGQFFLYQQGLLDGASYLDMLRPHMSLDGATSDELQATRPAAQTLQSFTVAGLDPHLGVQREPLEVAAQLARQEERAITIAAPADPLDRGPALRTKRHAALGGGRAGMQRASPTWPAPGDVTSVLRRARRSGRRRGPTRPPPRASALPRGRRAPRALTGSACLPPRSCASAPRAGSRRP